eukprot:GHVU01192661.1.p1 GENE.GHVU01192661.1~~GHVU01192661.1.p1  ORF type:complete len:183 (+),score=11.42 GHVU01192661.1:300-848(+)
MLSAAEDLPGLDHGAPAQPGTNADLSSPPPPLKTALDGGAVAVIDVRKASLAVVQDRMKRTRRRRRTLPTGRQLTYQIYFIDTVSGCSTSTTTAVAAKVLPRCRGCLRWVICCCFLLDLVKARRSPLTAPPTAAANCSVATAVTGAGLLCRAIQRRGAEAAPSFSMSSRRRVRVELHPCTRR